MTLDTAGAAVDQSVGHRHPEPHGQRERHQRAGSDSQDAGGRRIPGAETAGLADQVTVTAYDAYGNVADDYTGTVAFSSSDPHAVLPADYTFTAADAGTSTFPVTLETEGTQSITAKDSALTGVMGAERGITVRAAAARSLGVTGFPTADTAGKSNMVTVTAYDAYGNVADGYRGTVALSSGDGRAVLPEAYTFTVLDAGIHSFPVTLLTAGTQSITVEDLIESAIIGTQSGIVVSPAAASNLVLSGYPSSTAGVTQAFTVTAQDPYGNTAVGYTGTIGFESSDHQATAGAGLPFDYTFTTGTGKDNGVHTFSATLETAGMQSITARDTVSGTVSGTQAGIIVKSAAASRLVFGEQPTGTTAGTAIGPAVTVLIEDAYGNVVMGNGSTVTLTLFGGTFEGGSNTTKCACIKWSSNAWRHEGRRGGQLFRLGDRWVAGAHGDE